MSDNGNKLIDNFLKTFKLIAGISVVVLTALIIASCPNPLDDKLLAEVEDTVGPVITIISPDQSIKNYFGSEVVIEGIAVDYSDAAGTIEGGLESLVYTDLNYNGISGDITVEDDGTFTITFPSYDLEGDFKIQITAVDWNGNETITILDFFTDVTGPIITLDNYGIAGYNFYSSVLSNFIVTGTVSLPAVYVKLSIEWGDGTNNPVPVTVSPDGDGVFTFSVNPTTAAFDGGAISETLTIEIQSSDGDNKSYKFFVLEDDADAPTLDGTLAWDNSYVDLTFNEPVYHAGGTVPLYTDFEIDFVPGAATSATITGFAGTPVAGATSLRLNINVGGLLPDGTETIDIHPKVDLITDRVGNPAANSESIGPINLNDKTQPTVAGVSSTVDTDTYYNAGQTIPITVTFSETIVVTGTPTLSLNTSGTVSYVGVSGAVLTFNYVVGASATAAPLNYDSQFALDGVIKDEAGSPAVLTLPPTADAVASLRAKNLTIDTTVPAAPIVGISDPLINFDDNFSGVEYTISGEAGATYRITAVVNCSTPTVGTTGFIPATLTLTALGDGPVSISVEQEDLAGNVSPAGTADSEAEISVPVAPTVTVIDGNDDGYINSDEQIAGVTVSISGEAGAIYRITNVVNCSAPLVGASGALSATLTLTALGDGPVSVSVEQEDAAGNVSPVGTGSAILDTVAPTLSSVLFVDEGITGAIGDGAGGDPDDKIVFTFSEAIDIAPDTEDLTTLLDNLGIFSNEDVGFNNNGSTLTVSGNVVTVALGENESDSTNWPSGTFNSHTTITDIAGNNLVNSNPLPSATGSWNPALNPFADPSTDPADTLANPIAYDGSVTVTFSFADIEMDVSAAPTITDSVTDQGLISPTIYNRVLNGWSSNNYVVTYTFINNESDDCYGYLNVTMTGAVDLYGNLQSSSSTTIYYDAR